MTYRQTAKGFDEKDVFRYFGLQDFGLSVGLSRDIQIDAKRI